MIKHVVTVFCACVFALALVALSPAAQETLNYHYDEAGRLVLAGYESGGSHAIIQYQYDPNGNRTNRLAYDLGNASNTDIDDMADVDELYYFGDLDENGGTDPDGDGLVNSNEFLLSGNPSLPDTDFDGQNDWDESIAGTPLDDETVSFCIESISGPSGGYMSMTWHAVSGRTYQVQKRYTIGGPWNDDGVPLAWTNDGLQGVMELLQSNALYRVRVHKTN